MTFHSFRCATTTRLSAAHHRISMTAAGASTSGTLRNQYGEQALFVYNRGSSQATLYLGDAGWDMPHTVIDGAVPDLVLSESERLWVCACWQAATANRKEA